MVCPNCGKVILNETQPCPNCGYVFASTNVVDNYGSSNIKCSKNENGKKILITVILFIFALSILGFGIYWFLVNSTKSKDIFNTGINYIVDKIQDSIPKGSDKVSYNYDFSTNVSFNKDLLDPSYYSFVNKIKFTGKTLIDYKNKRATTSLLADYDNTELVNLSIYANDNNVYASLGDLFDKYINIPIEQSHLDAVFNLTNWNTYNDDTKVILNELKTAITKSLKNEYFKVENESLTIENKEVSVKTHSLVLNGKNLVTLLKDTLSNLNNDKFLTSIFNIYSSPDFLSDYNDELEALPSRITKEDIKKSIEEEIDSLNEILKDNEFGKEVMINISISVDSNNSFVNFSISSIDTETEKESIIANVTKTSKDEYSFEFYDNEKNVKAFYGNVNISDDEDVYKVFFNMDDSNETIEMGLKIVHGKQEKYIIAFTLPSVGTIQLNLTSSYSYDGTITMPGFENSKLYTELTDEDFSNILKNFLEKECTKNLMTDVEALSSVMNKILN